MGTRKAVLVTLCASFVALVLGGCEKEGPAERAGKQIDETVEKADEAMKEAGDQLHEATK